MSTYSFLISNFFWLTASRLVTKVVTLFSLPIITFYLSPKDFGIIAMFSVVQVFLSSFFSMGFTSYSGRVIYKYERTNKEECRKYLGAIFFYIILFSVFWSIPSAIFIRPLSRLLLGDIILPSTYFYYIPIAMAFVMSVYGFSSNILLDLQLNRRLFFLEMTQFILFLPAQLIGLIYLKFTVWDVLTLQLAVQIVITFYGVWLARDWVSFSARKLNIFKEAMRYSLPMVPLNFGGWIQDRVDKVFLNRMISLDAVGIYYAGVNIASQYSFLSRPIATTLKPEISKRLDSNSPNIQNDIRDLFMLFFQFSIFLYLAISLFSREIVTILLNVRFHDSYRIVPIFLLSIIFSELTGIFHLKFIFKNKTMWFPITLLLASFLNVVMNLLLIPKYNIYGASLAKALSELFTLFITYYVSQRLHRSHYSLWLNFTPLFIAVVLVFVLNIREFPYWLSFIIKGAVLIIYITGLDYLLRKYNVRYSEFRGLFLGKIRRFLATS
jgi:O-antigen/teichoic acid export membrane protein